MASASSSSSAPPAVAIERSGDGTERCVRAVVEQYRAWLKRPTDDGFQSLITEWDHEHQQQPSSNAIIARLVELGFRALPRASDHDGRIHTAGVWRLPRDGITPTSELGRMLGLASPTGRPVAQALPDGSVECCVWVVVERYRAWLAHPTGGDGGFQSLGNAWDPPRTLGKGNEVMDRLRDLGFRVAMRPFDHGGRALFDVWMLPHDRVTSTSELGRMLGLAPLTQPEVDAIASEVSRLNAAFATWLLANPPDHHHHAQQSVERPVRFDVNAQDMNDAMRHELERVLVVFGWCYISHNGVRTASRLVRNRA